MSVSRHRSRIVAYLLTTLLPCLIAAAEYDDEYLTIANATIDAESIAVIGVQQPDPEATVGIALYPGSAATGGNVSVELDESTVAGIEPAHVLTRIRLSGDGFDLRRPARIAFTPTEPLAPETRAYYVSDDGRLRLLPNQAIEGNQLSADLPHASSVIFAKLEVTEFTESVDAPAIGGETASFDDLGAAIETAEQAQQLGLEELAEEILEEAREALEKGIRAELEATPEHAICPDNTGRLLQMAALIQQIGTLNPAQLEAIENQTRSCARSGTVQAHVVMQLAGFCHFEETLPETRFLVARDGTISGEGDYRLVLQDIDCPIYVESRGRVELTGTVSGVSMNMNLVAYSAGFAEMPGPNEETPTVAEWDEDSVTLSAQPLFPNFTSDAAPDERPLSFAISAEDQLMEMHASDGALAVIVWTMKLGCDGRDPPQESADDCLWQVCHAGKIADVPSELMGEQETPPQVAPDDCLRQVCNGGIVADVPAELMNRQEIPPQESPNDCMKQVCHNGIAYKVDDPTEPGCQL